MALICDTGPLLAALDAADPEHEQCARLLLELAEDPVVPALVLAEVDYWCSRRLPGRAWLVTSPVCRALQADDDLTLGVVDARVIALAERLDEPTSAALDQRHFRAERPAHVEALRFSGVSLDLVVFGALCSRFGVVRGAVGCHSAAVNSQEAMSVGYTAPSMGARDPA